MEKIVVFKNSKIRRIIHNNEWWFVIVDVVTALTDSIQPDGYIKDMRRRDLSLSKGWGQIATPLSIKTSGGLQKVNCATTEGIFRIIQSIPSPKAEPFKRWLAIAGNARHQLEQKSGQKVSTPENYLKTYQSPKLPKGKMETVN